MTHSKRIASTLQLKEKDITAVITLLDDGNTLPFIARYRKEATGSLDEEQIRQIEAEIGRLRALNARRETILKAIEEQGQLTAALAQALKSADSLTTLEDLYQPYKRKRATRASKARERGLQPLADHILEQTVTPQSAKAIARAFVTGDVPTVDDALSGARDIVAETISDNAAVRQRVREKALRFGQLRVKKIKDAEDKKQVYKLYYAYGQRVDRLKSYQVLAVNRGEAAKVLRVYVDIDERDWRRGMESAFRTNRRSPFAAQLREAIEDAAKRLLLPAIERDVRRHLSDEAETHAIAVFGKNMRGLLSQPPLGDQVVLGIDPGFRSGSKAAVIDATGKVLATATIYPHAPQKRWDGALTTLTQFIEQFGVTLIAIGNGTASRETEQLAATLTRKMEAVQYAIVNEAGASVYSASPLARQELPGMDVSLRGAVSIARRVQDPLAELVKIDPKAIGVGLYQHDVNQKQLSAALAGVVETAVNQVGVDVNTASPALLAHVAGIGAGVAAAMVAQRDENGRFPNRQSLLAVRGLGKKAFEQAAGFLRVRDGDTPLDGSAIHPESYGVTTAVLQKLNVKIGDNITKKEQAIKEMTAQTNVRDLAAELNCGVPTLQDILEQIVRPGRDPRDEMPPPLLRSDVLSMADLQTGMQLNGTIRNVVDFGAFVDIGVKQDGLLHSSQIPRGEQLSVGGIVLVSIRDVDAERGRISLGWV